MLTTWRILCHNLEAPDIYIDFGWWSLVSGCLGRKVWIGDDNNRLYLNTYTTFVGVSGVGKSSVVDRVQECLLRVCQNGEILPKELRKPIEARMMAVPLCSNSATKASLVRTMSTLGTSFTYKGDLVPHATMMACLSEMSSLFRGYEPEEVVDFLTALFDCKPYQAETISRGKEFVMNGCLIILAATTPSFMMQCFESKILSEGIAARTWFIWADKPRFLKYDSFKMDEPQILAEKKILKFIFEAFKLSGPIKFTSSADEYLRDWYETKFNSERHNKSAKLVDYYNRKRIHVKKLAAIIAISQNPTLEQEITDTHVALSFSELKRIELQMDKALAIKPRNELFNLYTVITDFVSLHPHIGIDETYAQVAEYANMREFIDTLTALSKQQLIRFTPIGNKIELTTNLELRRAPLTGVNGVMNLLNDYERRP